MTHDPTSPSVELPQPPRAPYNFSSDVPAQVDESPAEAPEEPQEPSEAPEEPLAVAPENPKRIGRTIATELDKRVRVMIERQVSFEELLRQLGVVDPNQNAAGLRGMYVEALAVSKQVDERLARLKSLTNEVKQTLDAL